MDHTDAFLSALGQHDGQPEASYRALGALTDAVVGVKLFTLLTFDAEANLVRRFYSNRPDAYPVKGTKPVPASDWADRVLVDAQTFVANTVDEVAEVFSDHALIQSLGCEACINIPVVLNGTVWGTLNCLHDAGHYTAQRVAASEALKLPGVACFLLERLNRANSSVAGGPSS